VYPRITLFKLRCITSSIGIRYLCSIRNSSESFSSILPFQVMGNLFQLLDLSVILVWCFYWYNLWSTVHFLHPCIKLVIHFWIIMAWFDIVNLPRICLMFSVMLQFATHGSYWLHQRAFGIFVKMTFCLPSKATFFIPLIKYGLIAYSLLLNCTYTQSTRILDLECLFWDKGSFNCRYR
jgi:hypothetical protein